MVQIADLTAYLINFGLRLKYMNKPRRDNFSELSSKVLQLRYTRLRQNGDHFYGFKLIKDLGKDT